MSNPYDQERDREREDREWRRAEPSWTGTRGNGNYVTRGEFYARFDQLPPKLDVLHDRLTEVENRMLSERAKDWGSDILASIWGKIMVVVLATISAFVAAKVLGGRNIDLTEWLPW